MAQVAGQRLMGNLQNGEKLLPHPFAASCRWTVGDTDVWIGAVLVYA